jgi:uncharacterized membrane protein YadS
VVKLFRVFLLLPIVLAIGWWFTRKGVEHGRAKVPVPVFAVAFVALSVLNSLAPLLPTLGPVYLVVKPALIECSTWGLLMAIAALGLGTSFKAFAALGWRHVATVVGTTLTILAVITSTLWVLA